MCVCVCVCVFNLWVCCINVIVTNGHSVGVNSTGHRIECVSIVHSVCVCVCVCCIAAPWYDGCSSVSCVMAVIGGRCDTGYII